MNGSSPNISPYWPNGSFVILGRYCLITPALATRSAPRRRISPKRKDLSLLCMRGVIVSRLTLLLAIWPPDDYGEVSFSSCKRGWLVVTEARTISQTKSILEKLSPLLLLSSCLIICIFI
ncbi:hypothetical protein TNCV_1993941 [Trichonephila clavipes]|nr:hypothetical protein TNCV_1993941 [Trichonephila clavipes]